MHVELVDLFRCTRAHADSWLVAAATETRNRVIIEGELGCPVCGAEYPIHHAIADFSVGDREHKDSRMPATRNTAAVPASSREDDAFRLAAQLDLDVPGKTVVLIGYAMNEAAALSAIVPTRIVVVHPDGVIAHELAHTDNRDMLGQPAAQGDVAQTDAPMARIICNARIPIASASLHGVATREPQLRPDLVQQLRSNGRLIAPASAAMPNGATEIARDQHQWVATRDTIASTPIALRRQLSE